MSRKDESKDLNEKRLPPLSCAMVIELMSIILLFVFHFSVEISRYVSYVYFITLPCILLLSLCFGFTCTPLTLLQLRYILWGFIVYFGI